MELKRQSIYTAVRDVKMVPLMRTGILILHFGDPGAGAGDALPRRAAGVAAAGRPAGQLRRAVPGSVEIPQRRSCKERIINHTHGEKEKKTHTIPRNQEPQPEPEARARLLPSAESVSAPAGAAARTRRRPAANAAASASMLGPHTLGLDPSPRQG